MLNEKVTVELPEHVYRALKSIGDAFDLTVEELVVQGAQGEIDCFISDPYPYCEGLIQKTVKKIHGGEPKSARVVPEDPVT